MKQVLTIADLATINWLTNNEIDKQERMANAEEYDFNLGKKVIPTKKQIEQRLNNNIFYQDLLHLKNALNNVNVEVETADIEIKK